MSYRITINLTISGERWFSKRLLCIILRSYHFIFRTKNKHCTKSKLSCKKGTSYSIIIYLCRPKWFRIRIQRTMINREPGVNPGQSRCCETPQRSVISATDPPRGSGRLRNGSKSEDLPIRFDVGCPRGLGIRFRLYSNVISERAPLRRRAGPPYAPPFAAPRDRRPCTHPCAVPRIPTPDVAAGRRRAASVAAALAPHRVIGRKTERRGGRETLLP